MVNSFWKSINFDDFKSYLLAHSRDRKEDGDVRGQELLELALAVSNGIEVVLYLPDYVDHANILREKGQHVNATIFDEVVRRTNEGLLNG